MLYLFSPFSLQHTFYSIAFLSFGLGSDSLCMLTGISLLALGGSMVGLFLKFPDLFEEST